MKGNKRKKAVRNEDGPEPMEVEEDSNLDDNDEEEEVEEEEEVAPKMVEREEGFFIRACAGEKNQKKKKKSDRFFQEARSPFKWNFSTKEATHFPLRNSKDVSFSLAKDICGTSTSSKSSN